MLRAAKAALSAFWECTHRGWSQPTFGALVWAIDSRSLFNSAFGKTEIMMGMAKLVYTEQVGMPCVVCLCGCVACVFYREPFPIIWNSAVADLVYG